MPEDEKRLNELEDEELNEVAGGGTYNKDDYLRTAATFNGCKYFD